MGRKNLITQIVLALVVVGLYVLSGFLCSGSTDADKPLTPDNPTNNSAKQTSQGNSDFSENDEQYKYVFSRLEAQDADPDKTCPRDKYSLPLPETERSESFKALVAPVTEKQSWKDFNDTVFIGDSVTLGLQKFVTEKRQSETDYFGNAKFISVGSYGAATAVAPAGEESIHRYFNGVRTPPQDICSSYGAKKVYICLGLNDVGQFSVDEYIANYKILVENLRKAIPDVKIAIQSITPITLYVEKQVLYNAKIDEYNESLAAFAKEANCAFLDIADVLKDSNGYLATSLSSDDYCHLMPEAYERWVDYLLYHGVKQ